MVWRYFVLHINELHILTDKYIRHGIVSDIFFYSIENVGFHERAKAAFSIEFKGTRENHG